MNTQAKAQQDKVKEFASEYVTLVNGRRITQQQAAEEEADEAAEIAGVKVTKKLINEILQMNYEAQQDREAAE